MKPDNLVTVRDIAMSKGCVYEKQSACRVLPSKLIRPYELLWDTGEIAVNRLNSGSGNSIHRRQLGDRAWRRDPVPGHYESYLSAPSVPRYSKRIGGSSSSGECVSV